jgi:hypothetical protein
MKISQLKQSIGAGARSNKYRVLFPYFGENIDVLCHNVTSPGRSVGVTQVYLKGRKLQLAGDRSDNETIEMTFYNDPDMKLRRFFLQMVGGIQNNQTPESIIESNSILFNGTDLSSMDNDIAWGGSNLLSRISDTVMDIKSTYDSIRRNVDSIRSNISAVQDRIKEGNFWSLLRPTFSTGHYQTSPWYMTDLVIQQLDDTGNVTTETTLNYAFISAVGDVEYSDEIGEISQTTVTINFSGQNYGDDPVSKIILN